jgi:small subunit ribosomal protein S33
MARPTTTAIRALQLVQSQIYQTSYNPDRVRTGAKYLRKRLRGPSMVAYLPPKINLRKILDAPEYAFDPARPVRPDETAQRGVWDTYEAELMKIRSQGNVAEGFIEVERDETAGWLRDQKEYVRMKEVAERRAEGRGPPKKGEWSLVTRDCGRLLTLVGFAIQDKVGGPR